MQWEIFPLFLLKVFRYFTDYRIYMLPILNIVSSVNIFQKAINRKSLKWERFHCEIMSPREFERKLPRKTNCKYTLYGIFMHQKRLVFFWKEIVLFILNCTREIKRNNWFRAQFALNFRAEDHRKMVKFKTANNIWYILIPGTV